MSAERIEVSIDTMKVEQVILHEGKKYQVKEFNLVDVTADIISYALDRILISCDYDPNITKVYITRRNPSPVKIGSSFMLRVSITAVVGNEVKPVLGANIDIKGIPYPRFGETLTLID